MFQCLVCSQKLCHYDNSYYLAIHEKLHRFSNHIVPIYKWKLLITHQKLFSSFSIVVQYMATGKVHFLASFAARCCHLTTFLPVECKWKWCPQLPSFGLYILTMCFSMHYFYHPKAGTGTSLWPDSNNADENHTLGGSGTIRWRTMRPWMISGAQNCPARTFNIEICISQLLAW